MPIEMEHCTPINSIDIIHGIRYGLLQKGISETDLISQVTKEFIKKYEIKDSTFTIDNTYKSMVKRNSRNSKLYKMVLDYLEIDENIIATCYFSNLCAPELFSSLSARNQLAIIYLMKNLHTDFSFNSLSDNLGIEETGF